MELARLASKQQVNSKQLAPQGPFWAQSNKGPKIKQKCYHAIRDGFQQLSREQFFFLSDHHRSETVIWWGFGLFWAEGTWRNSGTGPKTKKTQFPGDRGPETEKKSYHGIRDGCPQLSLTVYVLAHRTPTGGKSRNGGISGHFGPGPRLAIREKSWGWAETGKMQFPGARGTFWGGIRTPQKLLPGSAQLFYVKRFGRPDPNR